MFDQFRGVRCSICLHAGNDRTFWAPSSCPPTQIQARINIHRQADIIHIPQNPTHPHREEVYLTTGLCARDMPIPKRDRPSLARETGDLKTGGPCRFGKQIRPRQNLVEGTAVAVCPFASGKIAADIASVFANDADCSRSA